MPLLPLLQETADTLGYMLLGYAVLLGLPALYLLSFAVRRRNLKRDLETVEMLAQDEKKRLERARPAAAGPTPTEGPKPADRPSRG
jgi:hypothetical protein